MTTRRAVLGAFALWLLFVGALALDQHRGLRTQMHDLGNADQAIWDASRGHLSMIQTNTDDGRPRSRLGVHGNFVFLLLALPYRIWPHPELLLIVAVVSCAAAGLGVWAFARLKLGDTAWAAVAPLSFLASPMVHDAALYDFHVLTVAAALLVWCVYAFESGRTRAAWALLALALLCNEDVPLVGLMLGGWLALTGRRREGAITAAASVGYWLLLVGVLVPAFNQGHGLEKLAGQGNRYAWLGEGAGGIALGALKHPLRVIGHLVEWRSIRVPLYLLASGGAVALVAWPLLLPVAPQVLQACLSELPFNTRLTGTYYFIVVESFIVLACVAAVARKKKKWPLVALGVATLGFDILLSPLPYAVGSSWQNYSVAPTEGVLAAAARQIPPDASLCVQNNLGAHFSQRRAIHPPPVHCLSAQYALFDLRDVGGPDSGLFVRSDPDYLMGKSEGTPPLPMAFAVVRTLLLAPQWKLLYQQDGFYLFSRDAPRRVPLEAGVSAYNEDVGRFQAAARENEKARLGWARFMTE